MAARSFFRFSTTSLFLAIDPVPTLSTTLLIFGTAILFLIPNSETRVLNTSFSYFSCNLCFDITLYLFPFCIFYKFLLSFPPFSKNQFWLLFYTLDKSRQYFLNLKVLEYHISLLFG